MSDYSDSMPTMDEIHELVREIAELLRGQEPLVLGAALADIVSMFFAGHNPAIRDDIIEEWVKAMRAMIEANEAALLKHHGTPPGWGGN